MFSFEQIEINADSRKPKYLQIVDGIIENIQAGYLKIDERLPSINNFSEEFYLSRDTVEKAYAILKDKNVIVSVKGKGYYVNRTILLSKTNVLFMINKLSNYKMRIYNAFVNTLGTNAYVDLKIYHCEESLFLNLWAKGAGSYDYYVVMPHFKTDELLHLSYTEKVTKALSKVPVNKLLLMDNKLPEGDNYRGIYQDFENDIYDALNKAFKKMSKYEKIILVFPEKSVYPYPKRILHGFRKFCVEHNLDFDIYNEVYDDMILKPKDLFITIEESDLINLLKQIKEKNLVLSKDIGLISYNDTPLKELFGITVISTDFKAMGETAADMILNNKIAKVKNPFRFIDRKSF
ncbi:GntR family transcriptional regulator [Jejuia pallidilutea]|uniref:GntR family transcriptional regulator n=1 Tax=Jejuia pallidilutea TaxID=504487 RepID=A0A362X0D9_9FLAO|nr:GntR family transcriptional regulator [Jejuia pallidilutea]PQV48848.1 GntR family transcriptional regulator [Jejuia pallidilutea]